MRITALCQIATFCLMAFAAGCSQFDQKWQQAMSKPMPKESIEGPWEGRWCTDTDQAGELRCVLEKSGPNEYLAYFDARYLTIFAVDKPITLYTTPGIDGRLDFTAKEYLNGLYSGTFYFKGHIYPERFAASYRVRDATGTFAMNRAG